MAAPTDLRGNRRWPSRALHLVYQPYKYLVFGPVLGVSTLVFGTLAMVLSLVLRPRLVGRLCGVPWARVNVYATPARVEVEGREHAVPGQSYVVVCNHRSLYDVLVLYGWLGLDFRWVMKQELRRVPVLGFACVRLGHVFVDRAQRMSAAASIRSARERITAGTSVLFFPEGTRSSDGGMLPFKSGAFRFALDLGLPLLPVTIVGTRRILPPAGRDLRPGTARLVFHPPIAVDRCDRGNLRSLMEEVRASIASGELGSEPSPSVT